jgi:hypothetical protein
VSGVDRCPHCGAPAPRTFDLRLWVTGDRPWQAVAGFFEEVRELAEAHPGISVRWYSERTDRRGRPRIRVWLPPRPEEGDDDAGGERDRP